MGQHLTDINETIGHGEMNAAVATLAALAALAPGNTRHVKEGHLLYSSTRVSQQALPLARGERTLDRLDVRRRYQ